MVAQHYRWDFIGLSTDTKPTASDSPKVVDGSTFYCSDNSKLYVWYNDQWYEKTATGGGGASYTAGTGIDITDDTISVDTTDIQEKLTAGSNITISDENEISATDTTYSNFTGTDGTADGTTGLVPAPETTDAGNFVKADGTWDSAGSSVTIEQSTGTSTTSVMSQKAVTDTIFRENSKTRIQIGFNADATAGTYFNGIAIGANARATAQSSIAIGPTSAMASNQYGLAIGDTCQTTGKEACAIGHGAMAGESSVALGASTDARTKGTVALGYGAKPLSIGEINVGSTDTTYGYNNSNYRLLSGLYDGQNLHDGATVAQGNTLATSAPTASTIGVLGQLYTDTTAMHTYQCTNIDTTDPDNPSYTWTQRW